MRTVIYPLSGMRKEAGFSNIINNVGQILAITSGLAGTATGIMAMTPEDEYSEKSIRKSLKEYLTNKIALQRRALNGYPATNAPQQQQQNNAYSNSQPRPVTQTPQPQAQSRVPAARGYGLAPKSSPLPGDEF